jgi:hypothetical protein
VEKEAPRRQLLHRLTPCRGAASNPGTSSSGIVILVAAKTKASGAGLCRVCRSGFFGSGTGPREGSGGRRRGVWGLGVAMGALPRGDGEPARSCRAGQLVRAWTRRAPLVSPTCRERRAEPNRAGPGRPSQAGSCPASLGRECETMRPGGRDPRAGRFSPAPGSLHHRAHPFCPVPKSCPLQPISLQSRWPPPPAAPLAREVRLPEQEFAASETQALGWRAVLGRLCHLQKCKHRPRSFTSEDTWS